MPRRKTTRKTGNENLKPRYRKGIGVAVDPLPAMTQGDENLVSPERVAQEATPQPYEGQYEQFRVRGETDRSGILQQNSSGSRTGKSRQSKSNGLRQAESARKTTRDISSDKKTRRPR